MFYYYYCLRTKKYVKHVFLVYIIKLHSVKNENLWHIFNAYVRHHHLIIITIIITNLSVIILNLDWLIFFLRNK